MRTSWLHLFVLDKWAVLNSFKKNNSKLHYLFWIFLSTRKENCDNISCLILWKKGLGGSC